MTNIDWKKVIPIVTVSILAGAALGTFVAAPALSKYKAKKLAAKKKKEISKPSIKKA